MTPVMKGERHVGGLWCSEVLARLTRHLDGTLSDDELAGLKAHVAGCDACAQFGGAFQKVIAALRAADDADDDADDDVDVSDRVLAAIDT